MKATYSIAEYFNQAEAEPITCPSCHGYGCPCDDAPIVCDGSGEIWVNWGEYVEAVKRLGAKQAKREKEQA